MSAWDEVDFEEKQEGWDYILEVEVSDKVRQEFRVHHIVLKMASPVLANFFSMHQVAAKIDAKHEAAPRTLFLPRSLDLPFQDMKEFLSLIYCKPLLLGSRLRTATLANMIRLATYFHCDTIQNAIDDMLLGNDDARLQVLPISPAERLIFADKNNLPKVAADARQHLVGDYFAGGPGDNCFFSDPTGVVIDCRSRLSSRQLVLLLHEVGAQGQALISSTADSFRHQMDTETKEHAREVQDLKDQLFRLRDPRDVRDSRRHRIRAYSPLRSCSRSPRRRRGSRSPSGSR